ncbi:MAG: hypothetical protein KIS76_16095 [Pyrinomonadaceae bacterium]|nr:hypothetical protein [Pyrinomonadaceae bacterium]
MVIAGLAFLFVIPISIFAQTEISADTVDESTIIVNDAPESDVYAFGKNVVVKTSAHGVLVFGGDVTIEGVVQGDVAAIGGSIIQKKDAFIGGDVIVFGGKYIPESAEPKRDETKETVMIAMFEDEIREFVKSPASVFAPSLSWKYLAQRLLSVLFWFVISLALTTIAPGAVSRSVARFQLIPGKVFGIGVVGFVLTTIVVIGVLSFLPNFIFAVFIPMVLVLLGLSFVYGRVALQVSVGKILQKRFLSEEHQSETFAILIGVLFWTILLTVPYLWIGALSVLISVSVGLVVTSRSVARS